MKCATCNGSGWEKREIILCKNCKGKSCYKCGNGLRIEPYETCRNCLGVGKIKLCQSLSVVDE